MPRIRSIKPDFFTSESVVQLSPLARLLFIGLWCEADREGRLYWKPNSLRLKYLPVDDVNVAALGQELIAAGCLELYMDDHLAWIPGFRRHQRIRNDEAPSQLPPCPSEGKTVTSPALHSDGSERIGTVEGKGKEGKGKEKSTPLPPKGGAKKLPRTAIPADWKPNEKHAAYCEQLGIDLDEEARRFRRHAEANDRRMARWDPTFMDWLEKSVREGWAAKQKPAASSLFRERK